MKSVLISIRPKWCELIASGKKTIEVRKTAPKLPTPFKCYIYCTSVKSMNLQDYVAVHRATGGAVDDWSGKVFGEFVCTRIDEAHWEHITGYAGWNIGWIGNCCLSNDDLMTYAGNKNTIYGWHISDVKIYDKPKELSEFIGLRKTKFGFEPVAIKRPPQSWCYVEGDETEERQ